MTDTGQDVPTEILDEAGLFRLSLMTDRLRDATKLLVVRGAEKGAVSQTADRYRKLRTAYGAVLSPEAFVALTDWTPELADASGIDEVYAAFVTLACWVDGVMETQAFLANRLIRATQIDKMTKAAKSGSSSPNGPDGSYL